MKQLALYLFIALFLVIVANSHAQYAKKGVIELGGEVTFSSTTIVVDGESADDSQTDFSFSPQFGYFIVSNIELVIAPTFSSSSFGDNSMSSFGIFLVPTYVFSTKGKLFPYLSAAIGYNTVTNEIDNNGTKVETTASGLSYGGQGGVKIQVGNSAIIDFGAFYMMNTLEDEDWKGDRNGFDIFGIAAGVSIFFGR